jgi:iron complex outermembrane receptor protein
MSSLAVAQQALERVEITGSNIKRVDAETASPVQVLSRGDIERTGKQSIQEVLRGITADSQGSIASSFSGGFAAGSSAVSLRGLGVNSTLVLVNGRRMTTYGLADDGARTFVDLNAIPLEAVDRVEVLKDGASAIYGADAVGGVVNIILRKNYNGGSMGASYGQTGRHDGQTTRTFGTVGFGDLGSDGYNAFFSLEASKQRDILARDRGFIGQDDLRSLGFFDTTIGANRPWAGLGPTANTPWGVIRDPVTNARVNVTQCPSVDPDTGVCRFNLRDYQQVQPDIERLNFFGRGTFEVTNSMQAYAEVGLFTTKTRAIGTPSSTNDGGVYDPRDPNNPVLIHGLMNLPAAHPDNPFDVDRTLGLRPLEFGGRNKTIDSKVTRIVTGLQGTAFNWDYDFGLAYIENRMKDVSTGYIRYSVMQAALTDGSYRVNNPGAVSPDVLAAISPTLERNPFSSISLVDLKASRELTKLPGGPLGIALGSEFRLEEADTPPTPYTDTADIVGLGYSTFSARRKVAAVYGELVAPLTRWLELNGALRFDKYSVIGNSRTPKFGFKLKPIDQLAVRGTYAEAFRAPGPAESGGSNFGFTSVAVLTTGNPNLKPEKAKSYTLGLVFEPVAGTSATVDFYTIDRKNEIVQADPATILFAGVPQNGIPLSRIAGALPNSFIYYDSEGGLSAVSGQYENATSTVTDGVDVELRQRMRLGEASNLSMQVNWTHINKFRRTDVFGNTFDYAGTHGPIVLSSGAGTPKDRASFSLTWDRQPFAVTGVVNYVGGLKLVNHRGEQATDNGDGTVTDNSNSLIYPKGTTLDCAVFNTDGSPASGCRLPSFTTFDVFAKWTPFKNLDLNFSIQNLFDRKAPFDPYLVLTYGTNYNQSWHQSGAVGRFFTVGAKYSF